MSTPVWAQNVTEYSVAPSIATHHVHHQTSPLQATNSDTLISLAFLAVFVLYCYVINTRHGHCSYWQRSDLNIHQILTLWRRGSAPAAPAAAPLLARAPSSSNERVLETVEEFILHEALSFLAPHDLLAISGLSRRFRRMLTGHAKVWRDLAKTSFAAATLPLTHEQLLGITSPRQFFAQWKRYPLALAQAWARAGDGTEVAVVIDGWVYALPAAFVDAHPGGDAILLEYRGADASRAFSLANHSRAALAQANGYLVWPPPALRGADGSAGGGGGVGGGQPPLRARRKALMTGLWNR